MKISVLSLAVQSALAAMCVMPMMASAADPTEAEIAAIRRPTNYIEVGIESVSKESASFGEYNGLNKTGIEFIGNFSVRGGDAYDGGNGTLRWGIKGTDLGTTSREFGANVGNQGKWNVTFGHDELRHNITDTYQTPQQGSMGGNTFTLPANFGVFNAAAAPSARTLNATQLGAFHTEDVGTTRKNTSFGAGFIFTPQLSLQFDYNHLAQSGAKLIAGNASGGVAVPTTATTWRAEAVAVLMNPTNYKTDTFNLALNWVGEKGHLSGAYYGSVFREGFDRLSYQNPMMSAAAAPPAGTYQTITLGTAPSNQFHQLNLTGGYVFSSATKLSGGLSYGRNTQNDSFLTGLPEIVLSPQASLNGLVVTKHADLKLSHQTTKDLALSAAYKYNERDNRTPSNVYRFHATNNMTTVDVSANAPYSNKKTELELAGEYRLDKRQTVRLAYDFEKISRWCNNYAFASSCLVDTSNTENKLGVKYKLKANEDVRLNVGYSYAKRTGSYDNNAITPLAGLDTLTPNDVNGQNYPGYVAVPYAGRKQNMLKVGVNWQASEKLELGVEGRFIDDKYDPALGVQRNRNTGINLDATYAYSEDSSVSAYASLQNGKKEMRIGATGAGAVFAAPTYAALVAPTNIWTNQLSENGTDIGIATKHKLMGGKLDLTGDISYAFDKSRYATQVPYLATCGALTVLSCGALPDIKAEMLTFKVTGIYTLDKSSKVSLGFLHQRLKSQDYQYNWFQYGFTGLRGMPTNQQAPNHSVNLLAVSYIYNFK
jgi:MtrB/PioB family decaheme-associated outer membrane protein